MINFHLGIPGLFPELLPSVAGSDPVYAAESLYMVSPQEYRTVFQELVNARGGENFASSDSLKKAEKFVQLVSAHETVAFSHPSLFGLPADVLRARKSLPFAEARVGRLSNLMGQSRLTFHLSITSQIDYILMMRRISAEDRMAAILNARFSWSELVLRIRRGAPDRGVVVWDFERPRAVTVAFVEAMLNINAAQLAAPLLKAVSPKANLKDSDALDYNDPNLANAVVRLDAQYEMDLNEMERMEGVTLVRPEAIPPDLHL